MRKFLFIGALFVGLPFTALAVEPDEILTDPVLEARAREISKELRCVVCQNQDIDSSNAGVARDLRLLVRERLVGGDSNDEVITYIQARYGDFVLLRPPFKPETYALWIAPGAFGAIALGFGIFVLSRSRRRNTGDSLSADEEELVMKFIEDNRDRNEV